MKTHPQIFYGLHMVEGVAEYIRKKSGEKYRVLVSEEAIKQMDSTFPGKPVFLDHVADVELETLEHDADGYVVDSFYNPPDGKHWCKFIVTSEAAKAAIASGQVLSNCYAIDGKGAGGKWHGVDYEYEVTRGTYDHLAIVKDPRYSESVIFTPEQFKQYNADKEAALLKLKNSNDENEKETDMKFFKKEKVANSADLVAMSVQLPKSGKEVSIEKLLNDADEEAMNGRMANGDDKVKCGDGTMTVNDILKRNSELEEASKKHEEEKKNFLDTNVAVSSKSDSGAMASNEAAQPPKKESDNARVDNDAISMQKDASATIGAKSTTDKAANNDGAAQAKKDDKDKEVEGKAENEDAADKDAEKNANALHFEALKNAENASTISNSIKIELPQDRVARGKSRYGSK